MNYFYFEVDRFIESKLLDANSPRRRAFVEHLKLVSKALHDIEWVDSGDSVPGSEDEAIDAVLSTGQVLEHLVKEAEEKILELEVYTAKARIEEKG